MPLDTGEIEEAIRLDLGRRRSPETVRGYTSAAKRFCRFTHKTSDFTRRDCLRYLDHLIEKNKSERYVMWTFAAIKRIMRCIEEPFPISIDDMPKNAGAHKSLATMLSPDKIAVLVRFARDEGTPAQQFYLAMSTVYGLRRGELALLTPSSFSPTLSTVTINTLKGGDVRTHVVPEEIRNVVRLAITCESIGYADRTMLLIFNKLCERANVRRAYRENWHSIRRALNTYLIKNQVPYHLVRSFLRWKSSSRDMPGLYFRMEPHEVDTEVFRQHPFLGLWR